MKKTSKRVLGILGLAIVAIITAVAAIMPTPGASALDTNPVTDQVTVRVVGSEPKIVLLSPENDTIYLEPNQVLKFSYENIETTTATVYYTDEEGEEFIYTIDTVDPNYISGTSDDYPLNLSDSQYGYGKYKITVTGVGFDGVTSEDTVQFSYYPVYGKTSEDPDDGTYYLNLFYDGNNEKLDHIGVNVYDAEGKLVGSLSSVKVTPPNTKIELPFAENKLPSGEYTIEITAYDTDGQALYTPYKTNVKYTVIPLPDTGGFFRSLNIARADLLITGLLGFIAVAAVAIILVVRSRKDQKR